MAMRTLLGGAHSDHAADDGYHGPSTLALRVIAAAVILAGGALGVAPPLIGRWISGSPDGVPARLVRALSGGTIMALALIHIVPEGMEQLSNLGLNFPAGGILVAIGLLSLVFIDYVATYAMAGGRQDAHAQQQTPATAPPDGKDRAKAAGAAAAGVSAALPPCCPSDWDAAEQGLAPPPMPPSAATATAVSITGVSPIAHSHHHLPQCKITTVRRYVACYTMELGCVFHSVIIGVGVGMLTDAPRLLVTMTAVMVFHQALEGLALGTVLAATSMAAWKKLAMGACYALCMPVGIAVGVGAAGSFEPESPAALAAQGVLNAVSGGMLLAVSMFSLIGEEFSKADLLARPRLAAGLMAAVMAGVGSMAVIGVWG